MEYPCRLQCICSFPSEERRVRHEMICPNRMLSCCQNASSCQRPIRDWYTMSSCRHGSNGFMGAIQENNIHLVRQFLSRIDCTLMHSLFTHETKFGDTLLTLAAALGRTAIVDVLIKAIPSLDQVDNRTQALSDVLDYETSRGKTPIIEAAKCNHADVVDILLRHHADPKRASKIHRKSALDWATTLGHANITRTIRDHVQLKELSLSLFVAVSKSDLPTIESLTAGGVPYLPNQDAKFMHALESKLHQVDLANQNLNGLSQAHQGCACGGRKFTSGT